MIFESKARLMSGTLLIQLDEIYVAGKRKKKNKDFFKNNTR
jgi:hypothetical protein